MEHVLKNNVKLIYTKNNSKLTSICIGLEAGAMSEKNKLGVAHATEHILYKGTKSKTEKQINKELQSVFGFNNAMTNYPYAIYYGTLLQEDFERGVSLLSDILINPKLCIDGFKEEMDVIKQELSEWDQDLEQFAEDKLFYNAFGDRLKYPIIGTKESLESITIDDIKDFYNENYYPQNTAISVVSGLEPDYVINIIDKYFSSWSGKKQKKLEDKNKVFSEGYYIDKKADINTSKIIMAFSINEMTSEELYSFRLFNEFFGEGVDSVLFDILRTKTGLVYDVRTEIAIEKNIELYKIIFAASAEKADIAIKYVKDEIDQIERYLEVLNNNKIELLKKSLRIKHYIRKEKTISIAKDITTFNVMFGNTQYYDDIEKNNYKINGELILKTAKKVLKSSVIEKITSI